MMCENLSPVAGQDEPGAGSMAGASRRRLLQGGIGLASLAGLGFVGATGSSAKAAVGSVRSTARTRAILVGTAGGPIWRQAAGRRGICTVVEVAGARYLVDAGHGASSGLWGAGAMGPIDGKNDLTAYRAGFLTHLHSDHVTDLATFLVQGFIAGGLGTVNGPFTLFGPGNRGALPHVFPPARPAPAPFNPSHPTPGTTEMVRSLLEAFGADINDRMFDAGSPAIDQVVRARDIALPSGVRPNLDGPPPAMSPVTVHEDELVRVSCVLVDHGQVAPSYAFRFDSEDGSIVVSGDTTLTPNLLGLADGCDLLLHEVIDLDSVNASISALAVPEETKEAFRNHMFGAHTTEDQLKRLVGEINVGTLVLHHVVPGSIGEPAWRQVAARIAHRSGTDVVAGVDDMVVGVEARRRAGR
jgi:ribonuclease BN (tRNA processing enzyme)